MSKRPFPMPSEGFSGFVLDPEQCSRLSMEEKRELVSEIAQWSKDAPEILSSFTRRELLEIICAEMGKERKYSGYTKLRMIEHLLKLVSHKSKKRNLSPAKTQTGFKRRRQGSPTMEEDKTHVCENVACRATLSPHNAFCKRCSCCICHQFDDNKDPSLWLTCGSDSHGDKSCGLTCHLICALNNERTGIVKAVCGTKLDGSFYCFSCGKVNELMRTWRKQMLTAGEARRVDVLCIRTLLGYKIVAGSEQYKEMQKKLETALQLLTKELGPLDLVCAKMARGIVKRLSCGAEVQKLCASALEAFDSKFPDNVEKIKPPTSCQIQFQEPSPTSVVIVLEYVVDNPSAELLGCMLWHRESKVKDYPQKPTYIILKPDKSFKITDLNPSTEYACKASFFGSTGILNVLEAKWITPTRNGQFETASGASREEDNNITCQMKSTTSKLIRSQSVKNNNDRLCSMPASVEVVSSISLGSFYPSTPCKFSEMKEVSGLGCKKQKDESAYEYSVRVIKWLESEGHIEEDFRVKFLTWFSLKATIQERKVVNVFVDAFIDDPPSLAGQLIHSFTQEVCSDPKTLPLPGFCSRLWH
ncbi:VIN3-like protein 2 isoform X2 [Euphorbia lathyris]|uniref:VIN3-like protein 2 isoform X2 n=1 Tax=Euphorbia lathyris TaxID=212925 RepID=UPI0033134474